MELRRTNAWGKCENVHGHNYRVRVTIAGEQLDSIGLLVDFADLKRIVRDIVERLDHQFLNEIAPFDALNPSAENMARYFSEELSQAVAAARWTGVRVARVKLWETDTAWATYRP